MPDSQLGDVSIVFQFYLSSIKSGFDSITQSAKLCFNSTLVQLKGITYLCYTGGYTRFNSTLVQLKVKRQAGHVPQGTSFNSTLVQLKADCVIESKPRRSVSILP